MTLTVTGESSVCMIIGDPVAHSISPAVHNAAYAAGNLPFVMTAGHVSADQLKDALRGMRALGIHALSVTMPHKNTIVKLLDELDTTARDIGAVNTVVRSGTKLIGYNTDWLGIASPLERRTSLHGKKVAIVGAGGAAQAAAYAAVHRGGKVAIFNRSPEKARTLAKRWKIEWHELTESERLAEFDIIINTTSVGMGESAGMLPFPALVLRPNQVIFETIYNPLQTALAAAAHECGATVILGSEMFLEQAIAQFELQTRTTAPRAVMEQAVRRALSRKDE